MSKSPVQDLLDDLAVRAEHADQMIVLVKTKQGNFVCMESRNVTQATRIELAKTMEAFLETEDDQATEAGN
jgi:hypothetical protein